MGGCMSDSQDTTDRNVEREIEKDKKQDTRAHKLLLLGAGGSGKSTFFKQLKAIHGEGHNDREKEGFKRQIHGQVVESIQLLIRQCKTVTKDPLPGIKDEDDEPFGNDDLDDARLSNSLKVEMTETEIAQFKIAKEFDQSCQYLLEIHGSRSALTEQLVTHVKSLWNECPAIQAMFEHRNKIGIPDSSAFFFNDIERIGRSDYTPDHKDIVLARYRTTGMTEKEFHIKDAVFKVLDVGGQRNERKKWIHFFDGVTAVLFVVSLTCYDEVPFEDVTDLAADVTLMNSMLESIKVFEDTLDFECFQKTGFILFFNKADLMQEKIKRVPITNAFPNYKGPQEFKPSVDYISKYFLSLNRVPEREMLLRFFFEYVLFVNYW
ncbi:Guanine nucleotide-binding protein alpha-3 subunit [Reticulomyxa filosa]|uniref:Guanine nucleotide-binding protein alpha-3 subunit n=1 Tax=Reticulomyxa filosa TaxID=46433 RepID=X6N404_RETFI|nr:Guanine nucleotide-binding protein alpha-3 subunit [Reticulomyxa filosa]|eukprot:ETO21010.1 Guanine nucleotide-binding protein alpha-3 subunit [Reticulomyxa filosa]